MEIFTSREGEILLKKYSPVGEMGDFAAGLADSMAQTLGELVCITDRDYVIAAAGTGKKEFEGKILSPHMQELIDKRVNQIMNEGERDYTQITTGEEMPYKKEVVSTVLSNGDCIGSVIILCKDKSRSSDDALLQTARTAAVFLGKHMEQ